jgi:hypothetical protein
MDIGVHTNLGAQYTQAALENWRKYNPWAAHIPWEQLPAQFRDTVEIAAGILAGAGHASRYRDVPNGIVVHETREL